MSRYIDAEKLLKTLCRDSCGNNGEEECAQQTRCYFGKMVEDAGTVEPVKHGRWMLVDVSPEFERMNGEIQVVDHTYEEKCNLCNIRVSRYGTEKPWDYCPNCGAKMDLEE